MKKILICSIILAILISCKKNNDTAPVTDVNAADYQRSFKSAQTDINGNVLAGTEIMHLIGYKGKLYAGNSYWMETQTAGATHGGQIFVLESPTSQWKLEKNFPLGEGRISSMKSITLTTDGSGNAITPVNMLLAAPSNATGQGKVYSKLENETNWNSDVVTNISGRIQIRALGIYKDANTGVDRIFAGVSADDGSIGKTFSGVFDNSKPSKINWNQFEFNVPSGERVMSFTICNGSLFAATSYHIYKRNNGTTPTWTEVYGTTGAVNEDIRGLSTIPNPDGIGEVMIYSFNSTIRRFNPTTNATSTDLDTRTFLTNKLGIQVNYTLNAYNEFTNWTDPATNENFQLIGFELKYDAAALSSNPKPNLQGWASEGRYYKRKQIGSTITYEIVNMQDKSLSTPDIMVATRTICISPFAVDNGRVVYAGGFDCNSIPSHNTGWIYKSK
jgi:hypothetical protein